MWVYNYTPLVLPQLENPNMGYESISVKHNAISYTVEQRSSSCHLPFSHLRQPPVARLGVSEGTFMSKGSIDKMRFVSTPPPPAVILVHSLVTSTTVAPFQPLSQILHKCQLVQNSAACIITRTPSTRHITPVLRQLHLPPAQVHSQFKDLLLTLMAIKNPAHNTCLTSSLFLLPLPHMLFLHPPVCPLCPSHPHGELSFQQLCFPSLEFNSTPTGPPSPFQYISTPPTVSRRVVTPHTFVLGRESASWTEPKHHRWQITWSGQPTSK